LIRYVTISLTTPGAPLVWPHLEQLGMRPPPGHMGHLDPPGAIVKQVALGQLARSARAGNERAAAHLLDLLGSPDQVVIESAIRAYYAAMPDRRGAQRTMRARLDESMHYLLFRH